MDRYTGSPNDWRNKGARFVRYLKSRPTECWGFFAAGALIGMIFL